jgi:hypothetical protein
MEWRGLGGGEHTRPRVSWSAPSPTTSLLHFLWYEGEAVGEGADCHTRGRVRSPELKTGANEDEAIKVEVTRIQVNSSELNQIKPKFLFFLAAGARKRQILPVYRGVVPGGAGISRIHPPLRGWSPPKPSPRVSQSVLEWHGIEASRSLSKLITLMIRGQSSLKTSGLCLDYPHCRMALLSLCG